MKKFAILLVVCLIGFLTYGISFGQFDISSSTSTDISATSTDDIGSDNGSAELGGDDDFINLDEGNDDEFGILGFGYDCFSDYSNTLKVTIDSDKIDETLTDFPIAVFLDDTNFVFSKVRDDGYDIRFSDTLLADCEELKYERDEFSKTDEKAIFHVKIPEVLHNADSIFYIHYGYADAADGQDPTNVWDSNFKARYSMKDLTTSTIEDSTENENDGTKKDANEPNEVDAKIGKGQDFDGTDDYIELGLTNDFDIPENGGFTVEGWINSDLLSGFKAIWLLRRNAHTGMVMGLWTSGTDLYTEIYTDGRSQQTSGVAGVTLSTGTWYYVVFSRGTDGVVNIWLNGTAYQIGTGNTDAMTDADQDAEFGRHKRSGLINQYFDGKIDEARFSNTIRSAAWIKASYNSGNNSLLSFEELTVTPHGEKFNLILLLFFGTLITLTTIAMIKK